MFKLNEMKINFNFRSQNVKMVEKFPLEQKYIRINLKFPI